MQQDKRTLLEKHFVTLSTSIQLDLIMKSLVTKMIFTESVVESIHSFDTEKEKRQELVRAVQRRGDMAYDAFYDALFECGQVELAALLEPLAYNNSSHISRAQEYQLQSLRIGRRIFNSSYTSPTRGSTSGNIVSISTIDNYQNIVNRTRSPQNIGNRTLSPQNFGNRTLSPQNLGNRTLSPQNFGNRTLSPQNLGNRTLSPQNLGNRTLSPQNFGNRTLSPQNLGNRTLSPQNFGNRTLSPQNFGNRTLPTQNVGNRTLSPQNIGNQTISLQNIGDRTRSPSRSPRVLFPNNRINYISPARELFNRQPVEPIELNNYESIIKNNGQSRLREKAMENFGYVFEEESMNYVDAPEIQRAFDYETMYPNFSSPRGLCLIINNEYFSQMPTRNGTKTDKENISALFRCMGYTIICKDNLTAREVLICVHDFTKNPMHRRCDSTIIVILSHGEQNQIIGVDDMSVDSHDLYDLLNASKAPLLANKPKIVFVQACRGERRDTGFPVIDQTDGVPALVRRGFEKDDGPFSNILGCVRPQAQMGLKKKPEQADILIAYATTAQFVSWRNSVKGSWFIQAICEVFSKHAKDMDIIEMLTEVNKKVACNFQTAQGSVILKQMPELTSRLVKKFYFWPCRSSSV